jgi:hypothetical protein
LIFIVSFHNLNKLINHKNTRKSPHSLACIFKDYTKINCVCISKN